MRLVLDQHVLRAGVCFIGASGLVQQHSNLKKVVKIAFFFFLINVVFDCDTNEILSQGLYIGIELQI